MSAWAIPQGRLQLDQLDGLLSTMSRQQQGSCLDLNLEGVKADTVAGAVLSAALLGTLGERPIRAYLPRVREGLARLAATGLVFALANRSGHTEFVPENGPEIECWKRPWSPGSTQQLDLFRPETPAMHVPNVFGPGQAGFVNPHLVGGSGSARSEIARLVPTWLRRSFKDLLPCLDARHIPAPPEWLDKLLPNRAQGFDRKQLFDFAEDIGIVIHELVENVIEHAPNPDENQLRSLVLVTVTSGGDVKRVHLSVIDNGAGILETVRPKLINQSANFADLDLVRELFTGNLETSNRLRGMGLPRVWRTLTRWDGSLTLWTSKIKALGSNLSQSEKFRIQATEFEVQGTVLALSFPLRKPTAPAK